jgi:hypothetical protein
MTELNDRLGDFDAGWRVGAESVLDMWQDGIDTETAAYIVTRKTTRRGLLQSESGLGPSTLMLALVALVTRIAARSRAIG